MLSPEQVKQIKEQLFSQLEDLPDDQRISFQKQIESMDAEQLEEFLVKNNMIKQESKTESTECVFCSIVQGKIPSHKLVENKSAIAILEINPISSGHVIIVPIKHDYADKIPTSAFALAKKMAQKIKTVLNPKKVDIISSELMGHGIINVLPIYEKEHLGSPRKKASEEELNELKQKLEFKKKEKRPKKQKIKEEIPISKLPKAPHRMP
ncbi:MAG: HIT domain-containing protein [Candidatus Pacearchaeota archaeon]|jgi:histidine triad (HIT) family protein